MVRGRVYRARPSGFTSETFFVVASNNNRNRHLDSVLVFRFTTSAKPALGNEARRDTLGGWTWRLR